MIIGGRSEKCRQLAGLIKKSANITLLIHRQPDGDALGSAQALRLALGEKRVTLCCLDPLPAVFGAVLGELSLSPTLPSESDLVIALDGANAGRFGLLDRRLKGPLAVIDNHPPGTLDRRATVVLRDLQAPATATLIEGLLDQLRIPLTAEIAQALLLGLYCDTGGFRHPNTTGRSLKLVAKLLSCGGNLRVINQALESRMSVGVLKLWGQVIDRLVINDLGMAVARVDRQMLGPDQFAGADFNGLSRQLLCQDVSSVSVLVEEDDGWSFKLKTVNPRADLRRLSLIFGGRSTKTTFGFRATNSRFPGII